MLKKFFTSLLGSLAAIWISIGILFLLGIFTVSVVIASAFKSTSMDAVNDNSILYINLATTISEENPSVDFTSLVYEQNLENVTLLRPLLSSIALAADDPNIKGIFIDAGMVSGGSSAIYEVAQALTDFRNKSGKWVIAYGDEINQGSYIISSGASELVLNPVGMVDVHGLSSNITFYTGLFEKLGIQVQVVKVGTFKSAVEPYILKDISPANRQQIEAYMGAIWEKFVSHMSHSRGLSEKEINAYADSLIMTFSPERLVETGLVDKLMYRHEVEDHLKSLVGLSNDKKLPLVSQERYYESKRNELSVSSKNGIAVLYAVGEISQSGNSGIASDRLVPIILDLAKDDQIKGMVLRVNSPGGSAFASEQIWEALQTFKKTGKTLYVSMGNYAASGGYYISCGADKIFTSPVTLTGSIGIFGLLPNIKGLLTNHLGITFGTVSTNQNGDFPSLTEPMTPFQAASMQNMINRGYETFVGRVAEGRGMSVDSVKQIAEGRVWAGVTAVDLGLADEIGDLEATIDALVKELGLDDYKIQYYPEAKTSLWDIFRSLKQEIRTAAMKGVMGDNAYEFYEKTRRLKEMDAVQCRMEEVKIEF
ncbi:MAG: signal peptide peptidase SppA [Muribaculaceae bacterium]|nr:signal peptide peptidase SppA [Muribaculaceae bacterium]